MKTKILRFKDDKINHKRLEEELSKMRDVLYTSIETFSYNDGSVEHKLVVRCRDEEKIK